MAIAHRIAVIPYSASRRVLESEDFALHLTSKQYYNSIRKIRVDSSDDRTIAGLVVALEDNGFVYQTRVKHTLDSADKIISRQLI